MRSVINLTNEELDKIKQLKSQYLQAASEYRQIDMEAARRVINYVWGLLKYPPPKIFVCKSPSEAQRLANQLMGTDKQFYNFGTYLTTYWLPFYAYHDSLIEFGYLKEATLPQYYKLREFTKTNIFATIEFDEAAILVENPLFIHKNEVGLHCTSGPALKWSDGYEQHFINNRFIQAKLFNSCLDGTYTREDYISEENDERRSAAYMILGEEKMMNLLGAHMIDSQMFTHGNGEIETIELYRTKNKLNKIKNDYYAWLKRICPSTGTVYMTPTNPAFISVINAAKFHRPSWVPVDVDYRWESRS